MPTRKATPTPRQDVTSLRRTLRLLVGDAQSIRVDLGEGTPLDFANADALLAALPESAATPSLLLGNMDSSRNWLICLIDAWPREKGVDEAGPTEDALATAKQIADALTASGWPRPVIAVSRCSARLLWRCDLPPESDLPRAFIRFLAKKYNNVKARMSGADPLVPQWVPFYGWRTTRNVKPASRLVSIPKHSRVVAAQLIERAIGRTPSQPRPGEEAVSLLESHGVELSPPSPLADGTTVYVCRTCPCPMRRGDDVSFLTVAAKGRVGLACLVTECAYGVMQRTAQENWRACAKRFGGEPVAGAEPTADPEGFGGEFAAGTDATAARAPSLAQGMPAILAAWEKNRSFLPDIEPPAPMTGFATLHAVVRDMDRLRRDQDRLRRDQDRLRRDMEPFLQAPEFTEFLEEWRVTFPSPVSASELLALADQLPVLRQRLGAGSERSRKHKLAVILGAHVDRQLHGVRIVRLRDPHAKMWLYEVQVVSS